MNANPTLLQMKYARIVRSFSERAELSLDDALAFFYYSDVYQLVSRGISDMHCMSDAYLVEDLMEEYRKNGSIFSKGDDGLEIRYMKKSDSRIAVSRVYEESWKYAYKSIVPQEYLESIKEGQWASSIEQENRKNIIAIKDKTIIGTSSFGKARMEEMENFGEIISLYLLPKYMRKGFGRLLLQTILGELKKMGHDRVYLWVLEKNKNARQFYEKCGFIQTDRCLINSIGGKDLKEVQYVYHNPNILQ